MIEGAVFDLGSTLIRFTGEWEQVIKEGFRMMTESLLESGFSLDVGAFNEAFQRTWQTTVTQRDIDYIERPMSEILEQVLMEQGHSQNSNEAVDQAVARMFSVSEAHWQPMPGVHSVLDELREAGLRLGIVSNASDSPNVHRLVDSANLRSYFDPIVVSAEQRVRKPDTRIFDPVLQSWGLDPQNLVMTGDSLAADIEGAHRLGMLSIWLSADADTPGNRAVRDTIMPDAIAEELIEVPDIIRRRGILNR